MTDPTTPTPTTPTPSTTCGACRHFGDPDDEVGYCTHPLNREVSDAEMYKPAAERLGREPQVYAHETCSRWEAYDDR